MNAQESPKTYDPGLAESGDRADLLATVSADAPQNTGHRDLRKRRYW